MRLFRTHPRAADPVSAHACDGAACRWIRLRPTCIASHGIGACLAPRRAAQGFSKVGIGGELRAGSSGTEGILPSFEGVTPSIPGYSRRAKGRYGETHTPNGDF